MAIISPGRQGSAQLTGISDILTTSAHLFIERETCETKVAHANVCEFTANVGKLVKHKVKQLVSIGFNCPHEDLPWGDDWAILRLEKPVLGVRPYDIPLENFASHKNDEPVVAVAGAARDFFEVLADGSKMYPRSIQNCRVRFIRDVSGGGSYVETDCDAAELTSGGSLLRPSRPGDMLLGIYMGSYELTPELEEALRQNKRNVRPYEQGAWASIYTSLDGLFLKELRKALAATAGLSDKSQNELPKLRGELQVGGVKIRRLTPEDQILYGIPDGVVGALVVSSSNGFNEGDVILEPSIQAIQSAKGDLTLRVRTIDGQIERKALRR